MRPLILSLALLSAPAAATPDFDALAFFAGPTEGRGQLRVVMHHAQPLTVHGRGTIAPDGTLVLDQAVEQEGKPTRHRQWYIRATAPGHYAGTLTDAVGPIAGETIGDRLHLTFRMKGGLAVEQWLTLAPNGQSARNVMRVRKLGLVVARLDETIRRTGG